EVDVVGRGLDELGVPEKWPDGLRAVAQLERARARLEEERRDQKEIVAADEDDFDVAPCADERFELAREDHAAESAAQDDDAGWCAKGGAGGSGAGGVGHWLHLRVFASGACAACGH